MKALYLMCAPSGAGKSYIAKKFKAAEPEKVNYISRDEIRFSLLKEGEDYFKHEKEVFKTFCKETQRSLLHYDVTIADATFLTPGSRLKFLNRLRGLKDVDVIVIRVEASLDQCLERNKKRKGRAFVPESVIRRQFIQFMPPTEEEYPYAAITSVV